MLRVLHFAGGRSLWLDEAMVADSIVHRDWAGLLQPLSYHQLAPFGWLFVEHAAFQFLGGSDFALRAPALLAGVGALLLFAASTRRALGGCAWVLAVAAFSISDLLVKYSAEVKPYIFDVLASTAALAFALRVLQEQKPLRPADHLVLLIAGLLAVSLSFPAAFVLAGLGGALILREVVARRWLHAGLLSAVSGAWLAGFAWFLTRTRQQTNSNVDELTSSWGGAYAPFPPTSFGELKWYPKALWDAFQYLFAPESMTVWILAIAIGAVLTFRVRFYLGLALVIPLAAALAASGLRLYPFSERLILFALPQLVFLAFVGVQAVISGFRAPVAASVFVGALMLFGTVGRLWGEFTYFPAPFSSEEILPVLQRVAAQSDVDAIYVNDDGLPAFRYYQARAGLADVPVLEGRPMYNSFGCMLEDMARVAEHRRVWVIFSHSGRLIDDIPTDVLFSYFADATGRRIDGTDLISVHAYLYEFDQGGAQRLAAIRNALGDAGVCRGVQRGGVRQE